MWERDTPIPLIFIHLTILVLERNIPFYYMSVRDTRSSTILVSERDTRSSTILVSERDTRSTTTILVSERDTRSTTTILVSERDTRSINLIILVHQAFFYTKASSLTERVLGLSFTTSSFQPLQLHNHIMQAYN